LESEQSFAPDLLEKLEGCPQERRLMLVHNSERFQTWSLCELVLERGFAMGPQDPAKALELTELGVAIAQKLSESTYSAELVHDLKARALSLLGNARRITSDLDGASKAFEEAAAELDKGTGDELELARVLELRSSLLFEYRNFREGFKILDRAIKIYRSSGGEHLLGGALIAKGFQLGELGDPEAAIATLKDGLKRIDGHREMRLLLAAKHNLVYQLYSAGRYHQALAMVPEVRALHKELGDTVDIVRFKWLEAKIAQGHGELESAEVAFCEVRDFFAESEIPHEVAQVSLDLATLYLRQGRVAELKKLSSEILVLFSSLGIGREAIAALVLFQQAVEMERVSSGLIRDLAVYLKSSLNNPHLPFRPSSRA
jgi:tetratricopeptide (TPR) repeat protein